MPFLLDNVGATLAVARGRFLHNQPFPYNGDRLPLLPDRGKPCPYNHMEKSSATCPLADRPILEAHRLPSSVTAPQSFLLVCRCFMTKRHHTDNHTAQVPRHLLLGRRLSHSQMFPLNRNGCRCHIVFNICTQQNYKPERSDH